MRGVTGKIVNVEEMTVESLSTIGSSAMRMPVRTYTLGELTPTKQTKDETDNHPVPDGCQYAADCDLCPFDDCMLNDMDASVKGDALRRRHKTGNRRLSMAMEVLVRQRTVADVAAEYGVTTCTVSRARREFRVECMAMMPANTEKA